MKSKKAPLEIGPGFPTIQQGMRRLVGASEMAQHGAQGQAAGPLGQFIEFGRCEAEPRHPGVDMDHGGECLRRGLGLPSLDLTEIVQHRHEPGAAEFAGGAGKEPVEDGDLRLGHMEGDGARRPSRGAGAGRG